MYMYLILHVDTDFNLFLYLVYKMVYIGLFLLAGNWYILIRCDLCWQNLWQYLHILTLYYFFNVTFYWHLLKDKYGLGIKSLMIVAIFRLY